MDNLFANPTILRTLATIAASIALVAITLLIAKLGAKQARDLWYYVRQYEPRLITAVDQPGDSFNLALDRVLDKVLPTDWDKRASIFLPAFFMALAAGLDKALAAPPREVAIPVKPPAPTVADAPENPFG